MTRAALVFFALVACSDGQDEPQRPTPSAARTPPPRQVENVVPKPLPPPPPPPDAAPEPPPDAAAPSGESEFIEVLLSGSTIKVNNRRVSLAQLTTIFQKAAARDPRTQVLVKTQGTVTPGRKRQVVADAEEAGLSRIGTMDLGTPTKRKKKRRR